MLFFSSSVNAAAAYSFPAAKCLKRMSLNSFVEYSLTEAILSFPPLKFKRPDIKGKFASVIIVPCCKTVLFLRTIAFPEIFFLPMTMSFVPLSDARMPISLNADKSQEQISAYAFCTSPNNARGEMTE